MREPFDLGSDLLFRLGVVRLAANRSLLVIAYHHLISDGFGAGGLLSRRLAEVYTALKRGEPVPELPHPGTPGRSRPRPRSTSPPRSSPRTRSSGATT
ncbi:condensation domain-containing protein [Streptomyces lasalocidi]